MFPSGDLVTAEAPIESGVDTSSASVDTVDTSTTDTGSEGAEGTEGAPEGQGADAAAQPEGQQNLKDVRPIVDGRVSPAFKPVLEKLKTESPQLAKAIE